jgi:SAM-dependent methyltransferase
MAGPKIGALRRICLNAKFETLRQAIERALHDDKYQEANKPAKIVVAESAYARGVTRDVDDERAQEAFGKESHIYSRLRNTYGDRVEIFVLDGKNSKNREDILEAFNDCAKPAILLTLVSVSGEGLDITCAADGILISPTYTVSSEEQFIRRMLRSGQKLPVRLQILNFSDSIEAGISDYSARKHRAVAAVMDGRPLNKRERAILEDDFDAIKKNGPIAYESLTPRQQALWILRRLKGLGKDGIKAFLYADDGKYAKDFARGYPADEETSTSGNTARLVASVIKQLGGKEGSSTVIADIACGCRTLELMFEGSRSYTVKSVDINEVALTAGAELLNTPKATTEDEVRTMDDLPFEDGSLDIGVISLALDMTQHSFNDKRQKSGQERIRTLLEISRVLKLGGKAIFSFQESLFSTEEEFNRFVTTIENHFGFRHVNGLTGLATAYNQAESEPYASWIVTFEKMASVTEVDTKSDELRKGLRFPHVSRGFSESRGSSQGAATQKSGAYQDTFSIDGVDLQFRPSTMVQIEASTAHVLAQAEDARLGQKVHELLERYPNISDIPAELLLSITPQQVTGATQSERDEYYRLLIEKYGSEDNIPTKEITDKNSHILIRRYHKTRGDYLCLAKLSKDRKSWVGCKTRYFYQA